MKVLHVEGGRNLYGGALQVLYLLEGLHHRGVENVLVCRKNSELSRAAAAFADVIPLPMAGDLDILLGFKLYRLIRNVKPDIAHLQGRIGADVIGGIAARFAGTRIVHSRRVDNPESRLTVALKYRLHDRVVAISEGIARVLRDEGLPDAKLRCVRSAVDPRPYQKPPERTWFREEFQLPPDSWVIGVVAQLIERKGHRFLLQALPPLVQRHPELRVLLFGKGREETALRRLIGQLRLEQQVHLAGFRKDLSRILPCLDLLVHPALLEGLGVSLLQAASAGVPIVASRTGGIPEAVLDGINGILVPPGDAAALAAAIEKLLADPALCFKLGEGGKEMVAREFSVDQMVEGNLAVYRELLGG